MQQIEMSFAIYNKYIIQNGFEEFKKLVDCTMEICQDKAIIIFHSDDRCIAKEFSNYIIALSAIEV